MAFRKADGLLLVAALLFAACLCVNFDASNPVGSSEGPLPPVRGKIGVLMLENSVLNTPDVWRAVDVWAGAIRRHVGLEVCKVVTGSVADAITLNSDVKLWIYVGVADAGFPFRNPSDVRSGAFLCVKQLEDVFKKYGAVFSFVLAPMSLVRECIYYRRGTPNSDGTITWSAVEQTVSTTYNLAYEPYVSVDSSGYVWIGYRDKTGTSYYPFVIKSGNNDGTWGTTPDGFPYQLSTISSSYWRVFVVPLTGGKTLFIYAYNSATVKVRAWSGTAWETEATTASSISASICHSAVTQGDNVHLVFLKRTK